MTLFCWTDGGQSVEADTNIGHDVAAGSRTFAIAAHPVTHKIYVANCGNGCFGSGGFPLGNSVTVIDATNNSMTTVGTGENSQPRAIAVNPATNKIYVANEGGGNVAVIDVSNNAAAKNQTTVNRQSPKEKSLSFLKTG